MFKKLISNFIPVVAKFFSSKIESKRELTESEAMVVMKAKVLVDEWSGAGSFGYQKDLQSTIKDLIDIIEG
jgi:hypothetical protein